MTWTREHGLAAFVAAVFIATGIWVASRTEWVDVEVQDPPRGPVLRDPEQRLKQFLSRLGATVHTPDNLERLPPAHATLVLSSWHWNLFPERAQALQRWVENGGELVVPNYGPRSSGLDWLPVEWRPMPRPPRPGASQPARDADHDLDDEDDEDDDDAPPAPPPAAKRFTPPPARPNCPGLGEPDAVAPAFGMRRRFATCMPVEATLRTKAALLWALDGPRGHVVARLQFGRGTVTLSSAALPWDNDAILERDNALLAAAVLRVQPGREIWLVTNETRPPLLSFLWNRGAPAVLLGLLALGFALWRAAPRFGPPAPVATRARRSVAEQIRGTAAFVARHGASALHAAQLRALGDAARPRVRGFDTMILSARAQAIATLTGLDAHALAHAMNPALNATRSRHPAAALALLETARRRLLNTPHETR